MVSIQMLEECQVVEIKLLTEVAVRMRQNLAVSIVAHITEFYVFSERLYVVEPLLSDENSPSLQANFAERFLVLGFQMPL